MRPRSNEQSSEFNNLSIDKTRFPPQQPPIGLPMQYDGCMPMAMKTNSNSLMSVKAAQDGNFVNFSNTVDELSSILPPRHSNLRSFPSRQGRSVALRAGNSLPNNNIMNEFSGSINDHSRFV